MWRSAKESYSGLLETIFSEVRKNFPENDHAQSIIKNAERLLKGFNEKEKDFKIPLLIQALRDPSLYNEAVNGTAEIVLRQTGGVFIEDKEDKKANEFDFTITPADELRDWDLSQSKSSAYLDAKSSLIAQLSPEVELKEIPKRGIKR